MRDERGQATVEWAGTLLIVSLTLGALASVAPPVDGRPLGGFLAHRLLCAAKGGCDDGDAALAAAYGARDAALVREHAPNLVYEPGEKQLPVDYRRCRRPRCAEAPDDRDLDAHRTVRGERATVFTRVLRRDRRTYIQYWLYYPENAEGPAKRRFPGPTGKPFANGVQTSVVTKVGGGLPWLILEAACVSSSSPSAPASSCSRTQKASRRPHARRKR